MQAFIDQNYLIIENNIVTNIVVWNGDTNVWTPPNGSIALIQATTPAMVWSAPTETKPSVLIEVVGAGGIGFTWDGTFVITNQLQPVYVPTVPTNPAPNQPSSTGTTSA